MTLLAFGCSVAHGADLVHLYESEKNTELSYPNLVANQLGIDCKNYAVNAISNEGIFHKILELTPQHKDITAIIVGWTSDVREHWHCEGRDWFFIPNSAGCMMRTAAPENKVNWKTSWWTTDKFHSPKSGLVATFTDNRTYLDPVMKYYEFLIKYKVDFDEYAKKRQHYVETIRLYCQSKGITLIETYWAGNSDGNGLILSWEDLTSHPGVSDHEHFANQIVDSIH